MNKSWALVIGLVIVSLSAAAPVPAPVLTDDQEADGRNIELGIRAVLHNVIPAVVIAGDEEERR